MSNEHTQGPWYASPSVHQGIVISEPTGLTVAVTYDAKDADLVAAAPDLFEAAVEVEFNSEECLDFDECMAMLVPIDTYHKLMDAINKAKGL